MAPIYRYKNVLTLLLNVIAFFIYASIVRHCNFKFSHKVVKSENENKTSMAPNITINNTNKGVDNDISNNIDRKMLALFYHGCSGSTITQKIARSILEAHGFKLYKGVVELDNKHKNPYFKEAEEKLKTGNNKTLEYEDVILEALRLLNNRVVAKNQVLFFKPEFKHVDILKKLDNVLFTGSLRRNKLDRAICWVKDCFHLYRRIGYPVFAENGTKADHLCFKRRHYPNINIKVRFYPAGLKEFLYDELQRDKDDLKNTQGLIAPGSLQYDDDLFAFEYTSDDNTFNKSIESWHLMLSPFATLDKEIIKNILLPLKNKRELPSPHFKSIENLYDIKKALEEAKPPLDHFLRFPDKNSLI